MKQHDKKIGSSESYFSTSMFLLWSRVKLKYTDTHSTVIPRQIILNTHTHTDTHKHRYFTIKNPRHFKDYRVPYIFLKVCILLIKWSNFLLLGFMLEKQCTESMLIGE